MLITQDRLAIGDFLFLSLAITNSVYVTFDLLFGGPIAAILAGLSTTGFGWFW